MKLAIGCVMALVLAPGTAAAGPGLDLDLGIFDPPADPQYGDLVTGGIHASARPMWLFDLGRHVRGLSVGPTAVVSYTSYDLADEDEGVEISRLRVLGGVRVETRQDRLAVGLHLAAGVDRPHYDFSNLLEDLCGDPTTSGLALEALAGATYRLGHVRVGGQIGFLKGYHGDDRPRCQGDIVVDIVDYESTDLVIQATVGFAL